MQQVKRNYDREMRDIIKNLENKPRLLLHVCCAPCSSAVLEKISQNFEIYSLFYNPNISPESEFNKRKEEFSRLVKELDLENSVKIINCEYDGDGFYEIAKGLENEPEGGARCEKCFKLRLEEAAQMAKNLKCDYFTTTLTISPMKNSALLNEIGENLEKEYRVKHLPSDFKKGEGYKRSIVLSKKHSLYRQNYCGCVFSKAEAKNRLKNE